MQEVESGSCRFAVMTDLHFGPLAHFEGKLRKMTHQAPELLRHSVRQACETHGVEMIVNLGDDIEDESPELDRMRYAQCQALLREGGVPVVNVAGNHDSIHLSDRELVSSWGREGQLYYSFDHGGYHFVVLRTHEWRDEAVVVDEPQLRWLERDLSSQRGACVVLMHHSASDQDLSDSRWFHRAPHLALIQNRVALRGILEESGRVLCVLNGHVHRNHLDVIRGIPYVTFQSMIENLDDDTPGRAAGSFGIVEISRERCRVVVHGQDPARYQFERGPGGIR